MNGSGRPVIGMMPIGHADVDEGLDPEPDRDAGGHEHAELVVGAGRDAQRAEEHHAEQGDDDDRPAKPSSSPATVKMKSVRWSGTKLPEISWPWNRPWPNMPPEPIAILDWVAL